MYCPKCGHQNKGSAAFCIQCGTALAPAKAPVPTAPEATPGYNAPPPGYQAPPEYQPAAGPYAGYAPRQKKRTGLIVGLSIGGVVLVAIIAVIVFLLTGNESAEGIWYNEKHAEVLEFDDGGDVIIYTVTAEIDGSFELDPQSGEGEITTDDRTYNFLVRDKLLIINDQRGYVKMSDDFDIDEFIEDAASERAEASKTEEGTAPTLAEDSAAAASTVPPTNTPTQIPSDTVFAVPNTDVSVIAPDGWYVYEDMYDDSYVMCLTNGDDKFVDFYLWPGSAADVMGSIEETYDGNIVGSAVPLSIGGFQAYRLQYALFEDGCFQGYEVIVDLPEGTLEMDMYVMLPDSYTETWDESNTELQLLQSIVDSLKLSGQARLR